MERSRLFIGILDPGLARIGEDPRLVVEATLGAARRAELLGYTRYWLTEHHNEGCAWASPEVVLGLLARETTRLRVGTGGLLFNSHNPLRVANDFSLLSHLFPGRVELGLARGSTMHNRLALSEPVRSPIDDADGFSLRLVSLLTYLRGAGRPQHAYMQARAVPQPRVPPPVWLLGTGHDSMALAARYGLPFAHSVFHLGAGNRADILREYHRDFRPSTWLGAPHGMIALAGVCAETEAEARVADAASITPGFQRNCVGAPAQVAAHMRYLAEAAGVTDVLYLELSPRPEQRLRAYELLANELGLSTPDMLDKRIARAAAPMDRVDEELTPIRLVS